MRRSIGGFVFLWALLLATSSAFAQNAQVTGTVKDQSGGVMPGVTVTAKNNATGLTRTEVTDAGGAFRLVALLPGSYTITVELQGFNTQTLSNVSLAIDQTATLDFSLKPASLSENVTVTGEAPIVDVSRSDVGTALTTSADSGSAGRGATLDRHGDADARLLAGQHPRPVLSRQRQHRRRRDHVLFDRQRRRRREQHVGRAGRDAAELPDGRDRGIQGVDLFLQGRIRPRDRRRRQRRDEDRFERFALFGFPLLQKRRDDRAPVFPVDEAALLAVAGRRIDWRSDHQGQDPLLLHLRANGRESVQQRQHAGVAAVHRKLSEQAVSMDLPRTRRRAAHARAIGVRQVRPGVRVPSGAHGRRHGDPELQLRLLGAAHVGRRRAYLGDQPARAERFPIPVRVREVRGLAAGQPRIVGRRLFRDGSRRALPAGLQLSVGLRRRVRQQPDGTGASLSIEG